MLQAEYGSGKFLKEYLNSLLAFYIHIKKMTSVSMHTSDVKTSFVHESPYL